MRQIVNDLKQITDDKYKKFASGLLPGVNYILGVRVPKIRAYAKTFSIEEAQEYCSKYKLKYFEEYFLKGLLIAKICKQLPPKKAIKIIEDFIPQISNWSVCDAFCADLKIIRKYKKEFLPLILKNLKSKKEFTQRTAINLARAYYLDDDYAQQIINAVSDVKAEKYYSQMAQAWFMCEACIKQPKYAKPALKMLTPEVYKMAERKIKDSYRI